MVAVRFGTLSHATFHVRTDCFCVGDTQHNYRWAASVRGLQIHLHASKLRYIWQFPTGLQARSIDQPSSAHSNKKICASFVYPGTLHECTVYLIDGAL